MSLFDFTFPDLIPPDAPSDGRPFTLPDLYRRSILTYLCQPSDFSDPSDPSDPSANLFSFPSDFPADPADPALVSILADLQSKTSLFPNPEFKPEALDGTAIPTDLQEQSSLFPIPEFSDRHLDQGPVTRSFTGTRGAENSTLFNLPRDWKSTLPVLPYRPTVTWPKFDGEKIPDADRPSSPLSHDGSVFSTLPDDDGEDSDTIPDSDGADVWIRPDSALDVYVSEAGTTGLDQALEEWEMMEEGGEKGWVVREDVFCACLLNLGLGRSSVLFYYDTEKGAFAPRRERVRVSGCAAGTVDNIVKSFAQCGLSIKKLQSFTEDVYKNINSSSATLVAIAGVVDTIRESIQKRFSTSYDTVRSILHLHSLLQQPALIIDAFVHISNAAIGARDDCELLTKHFEAIQQQQHRTAWLRPLLIETLARVTRPWLEVVEQWIGLKKSPGGRGDSQLPEKFFVKVKETVELDELGKERKNRSYTFDKSHVPSFMSLDMAENIYETGRSLRFLESFKGGHPLTKPPGDDQDTPKLEWKFSWADLQKLQEKAKAHEDQLIAEVNRYKASQRQSATITAGGEVGEPGKLPSSPVLSSPQVKEPAATIFSALNFDPFTATPEEISAHLQTSISKLSQVPATTSDQLSLLLSSLSPLSSTSATFPPPLTTTSLLSFSNLLSAHSRIIHQETLHLFLHGQHKLQDHLSTLRRYFLMGDGMFVSRLSDALFSPVMTGTEKKANGSRRVGAMGGMGLRLGDRTTWPPGGSELRLALMDVLDPGTNHHSQLNHEDTKPDVSFSIRTLSPTDLDKITDPTSLSALDFLRLEYKPPAPLNTVISTEALWKYDRIWFVLLRITRMVYVVNNFLPSFSKSWASPGPQFSGKPFTSTNQDSNPDQTGETYLLHRFSLEARHFILTLADYFTTTAISLPWSHLLTMLSTFSESQTITISHLSHLHDTALDRILFAMLARKRQKTVMQLVENVCGYILQFAAILQRRKKEQQSKHRNFPYQQEHVQPLGVSRGERQNRGNSSAEVGEKNQQQQPDLDLAQLRALHTSFAREIRVFIKVCRGLSEKRGYVSSSAPGAGTSLAVHGSVGGETQSVGRVDREEANLLGMLVVRMEMGGFWERREKRERGGDGGEGGKRRRVGV